MKLYLSYRLRDFVFKTVIWMIAEFFVALGLQSLIWGSNDFPIGVQLIHGLLLFGVPIALFVGYIQGLFLNHKAIRK
jgi:hypothetical protein